jgi:hypothetical protein
MAVVYKTRIISRGGQGACVSYMSDAFAISGLGWGLSSGTASDSVLEAGSW